MAASPKALRLHQDAEHDLLVSISFYREQAGEPLAARFKRDIEVAFESIVSNPDRFPRIREIRGVRRVRLHNFPFSILYVERADEIWVVAIAHGSRKPRYWRRRLS